MDDDRDVVEGVRYWIVHLEQTHASPNTIRAYVRHFVDFTNFLRANGAGIDETTVALDDGFFQSPNASSTLSRSTLRSLSRSRQKFISDAAD